jgi:hypothetical protein
MPAVTLERGERSRKGRAHQAARVGRRRRTARAPWFLNRHAKLAMLAGSQRSGNNAPGPPELPQIVRGAAPEGGIGHVSAKVMKETPRS